MQIENIGGKSGTSQATSTAAYARTMELDLGKEIEELHRSPEWQTGIARKELVHYPDLQITLRAMKAATRISQHYNPGRICVQTVCGHIRMHADDKFLDLPQGKMLILDRGVTHDVEAVEESAFLLTVAPPADFVS